MFDCNNGNKLMLDEPIDGSAASAHLPASGAEDGCAEATLPPRGVIRGESLEQETPFPNLSLIHI